MRLAILLLLAAIALSAQSVEGRVVNELTGAPVAGAKIMLYPVLIGPLPAAPFRATTTDDGRFTIDNVPEGVYTPLYSAPGYFGIPGPTGPRPTFAVSASSNEPVHLDVKLQPTAKISGRVLDSNGKPVPLADVWLIWTDHYCKPPACFPYTTKIRAWTDGTYKANDLPLPGAWLLAASAPDTWPAPPARDDQPMAHAQTFYPNTTDPDLAEPIIVRPGAQLWDVDIKLKAIPAFHVRGRILDPRDKPAAQAKVVLAKGFGPDLTTDANADGVFDFPAVPEAEWRLSASLEQGSGNDRVKLWAAQWIELRRRDLDAPVLRLNAPFTLEGKVVMQAPEGTPTPPSPPRMYFVLATANAVLSDMRGAMIPGFVERGVLTFREVYPGAYKLEPVGAPAEPYYLDSIRVGTLDATAVDVPILSAADPLVLTYKLGGGTVRGTLETCGGASIVLVPVDAGLRRAGFIRVNSCDPQGKFEFPAVRPGEYYAFATTRTGPLLSYAGAFADSARLAPAAKVTVRDRESTTVAVRLVY